MQNQSVDDLRRRSRYHQGMIDLSIMERGKKYSQLPDSYIIFICPFDVFGDGLHKYSFEYLCVEAVEQENAMIRLGDGSHKVFLCAGGLKDDVSPQMKAFLDYISGHLSDDDFCSENSRRGSPRQGTKGLEA